MITTTKAATQLPQDLFDELIERWNGRRKSLRSEASQACSREGHVFVLTPMEDMYVCLRCCSYYTEVKP